MKIGYPTQARNRTDEPEVYWVVAGRTNAGKTTVAAALIKYLNKIGRRAVGFKPFGGMVLAENFDFICNNFRAGGRQLYGIDAVRLAEASPLTDTNLVEVIGPSYRLVDGNSVVLVRKGSLLLNNRSFLKPRSTARFDERDDIKRLVLGTGLPFRDAGIIESTNPRQIDVIEEDKVTQSFLWLKSLGIDAVVMEGASSYLPIWNRGPAVDHVFEIIDNQLSFYPRLRLKFSKHSTTRLTAFRGTQPSATPHVRDLKKLLVRKGCFWLKFEFRPIGERDAYAVQVVAELLSKAGI